MACFLWSLCLSRSKAGNNHVAGSICGMEGRLPLELWWVLHHNIVDSWCRSTLLEGCCDFRCSSFILVEVDPHSTTLYWSLGYESPSKSVLSICASVLSPTCLCLNCGLLLDQGFHISLIEESMWVGLSLWLLADWSPPHCYPSSLIIYTYIK